MFTSYSVSVVQWNPAGCAMLAGAIAVAGLAVWAFRGKSDRRCPRCGAAVWRFARSCHSCGREIAAHPAGQRPGMKPHQTLAGLLTLVTLLIVGGLVVVLSGRPSSEPAQPAAHDRPLPSMTLPPARTSTQGAPPADDPWPEAAEAASVNSNPQFEGWVAASKADALQEHPALGVPGSDFQIALAARYRELVAERSPRLNDPRWPEELANEVAMRLTGNHQPPVEP